MSGKCKGAGFFQKFDDCDDNLALGGCVLPRGSLRKRPMKRVSMLLAAVAFTLGACERHEFEGPDGTKRLSEPHEHATHSKEKKTEGHTAEEGKPEK